MPNDIQTARLPAVLHRPLDRHSRAGALSGYGLGLGKTAVTLTAVNELIYYRFQAAKALVIAPKKVAEATWQDEVRKWDHLSLLRVSTVLGSAAQRIRALAAPADVYIINRENTAWLVDYYRNSWPFDMVILDESSSFKDRSTKRWRALKAVRPCIRRMVLLTGTPSPNGLADLWAQVFLLDGGARLGKTLTGFREQYFLPDKRSAAQVFTYKPRDGAEVSIREKIGDICVSMKAEDYLQLPECVAVNVPVVLDARAQKLYDCMEREMLLEIDGEDITAESAAVLTQKLLQLAGGAVYDAEHQAKLVHGCKVEAFLELVEALNGQHALVFYAFVHEKERLLAALKKSGLRVRVFQDSRDAEAWNAGQVDLLLAHPASTAYGLNLQQGGSHVIWFGLTWSLELYQQANKRLHRQGQSERVIIHHLAVRGSVDEDVLAALDGKADTQEALLQSLKARIENVRRGA